ncbi:hypothetical protein GCM10009788_05620 [Nocardioides humi]|uniref:Uncharacterized protein n=1 Tax=Nocardioides humi TaxID=449461 RepID=A0ABN1ZUM5_9ACTN
MAGKANAPDFAASSISAYFSGVAMGMLLAPARGPVTSASTYRDNRSVSARVSLVE